jgi:hypothetical protein
MNGKPVVCEKKCECVRESHDTRLVVLTGGPGAGKTAVLEMAKKVLCEHVAVLPESASIVFGGGFWRLESKTAKLSAQRAIYHVQREMEDLVVNEKRWAIGLCDRGTLDGLAYWQDGEDLFWKMLGHPSGEEFSRYKSVIHLRSPSNDLGYNHQNPLRVESADQAQQIDEKIHAVWSKHPNYKMIPSSANFVEKANAALRLIAEALPECCKKSISESTGTKT